MIINYQFGPYVSSFFFIEYITASFRTSDNVCIWSSSKVLQELEGEWKEVGDDSGCRVDIRLFVREARGGR